MAGQPIKRALIAELERRGKLEDPPLSGLDYVCEWVAGGQTMRDLVRDVNVTTKLDLNLDTTLLSSYVNATKEGKQKMIQARAAAAHILAEQGMEILDDADEDRDAIAKAKGRAEYRRWLAGAWNREAYGQQQAQVSVNVNLAQLHIDAMRKREIPVVAPQPALEAGADYEVLDG